LEEGHYFLSVRAALPDGSRVGRGVDVVVKSGQETQVHVDISGHSGVRGRVLGTGNGSVGAGIRIIPQDLYNPSTHNIFADTQSVAIARIQQPGNTFNVGSLETGSYIAVAELSDPASPERNHTVQTAAFTVTDGQWADIVLDFSRP
jgi:hypothetical protein